jgi:hypothetical protein
MKIHRLDAHDRFKYFLKQEFDIAECCQDLINKRPFGDHPFYIFAHARTIGMDEKFKLLLSGKYPSMAHVPEKTVIWQPRLTKPLAQTNSMLFKAYPGSDNIKIIWILPPEELWSQYKKDNMMQNETIIESIHAFESDRQRLEAKEDDDLSEEEIHQIYKEMFHSPKMRQNETQTNN